MQVVKDVKAADFEAQTLQFDVTFTADPMGATVGQLTTRQTGNMPVAARPEVLLVLSLGNLSLVDRAGACVVHACSISVAAQLSQFAWWKCCN